MIEPIGSKKRVSLIGLGAMGSGIARTLLDSGYQVSVWNRSRDKVDAMTAVGATACSNPSEALKVSALTVVCVADYVVWNEIIETHALKDDFEGKCIIQLTGGSINEVQQHAAFIEAYGGRLADGAVMCFPRQLGTADASLLVAGAPAVLDECTPLFHALAPEWTNLEEDITKPAVLSRALTSGILPALLGYVNGVAICQAAGISLDVYIQQAEKANAFVPAEKRRLAEAIRDGQTEETQASIDTWRGAHQTIDAIAGTLGTNLVLQNAVKAVLHEGQESGLGDHDLSALVKVFISKPQ